MRKSRISREKQKKLLEYFVAGVTGRTASELAGVNFKTGAYYFRRLRELICSHEDENVTFDGEVEVDESYFGGTRKGKRGRGAGGKVPVFGLLKRGGKVYVKLINNAKTATLLPIIRNKIKPDSVVYTDSYRSYNVLDVCEFKHFRINHSEKFAQEKNHINGIENFWNQAKRHLRKFNGIPKEQFYLYIKECQWRFNNPSVVKQLDILYTLVEKELF